MDLEGAEALHSCLSLAALNTETVTFLMHAMFLY